MKKTIAGWFIFAVVLTGVFLYKLLSQPVSVEQTVIREEVEITVDQLSELIADAISASTTEHTTEAQTAYDEKLEQLRKEKELEVIKEYREAIESRELELEKETKLY